MFWHHPKNILNFGRCTMTLWLGKRVIIIHKRNFAKNNQTLKDFRMKQKLFRRARFMGGKATSKQPGEKSFSRSSSALLLAYQTQTREGRREEGRRKKKEDIHISVILIIWDIPEWQEQFGQNLTPVAVSKEHTGQLCLEHHAKNLLCSTINYCLI